MKNSSRFITHFPRHMMHNMIFPSPTSTMHKSRARGKHNNTADHFRRPGLFSAVEPWPPKITCNFRRSAMAAEISAIFGGYLSRPPKLVLFSAA
jgi:hypothetical protein